MVNLNCLRVFYMVAKHKSVASAGEKLFISQPAVSNALKKLQSQINLELFIKNGRNLELTSKGQDLFALAHKLFETENEINNFLSLSRDEENTAINVGIVTLYERFGMIELMSCFGNTKKQITVSVKSGNSLALLQLLLDRKIDICITGELVEDTSKLLITTYRRHIIHLIIPKRHKLYGKKFFLPEDIDGETMIYKEHGSSVRQAVDNYFKYHNIKGKAIAELSNLDSILSVAEHENCLCFIPDMALNSMIINNQNFSSALPHNSSIFFDICVVTRKKEDYSSSTWEKIEYFLEQANRKNL